MNIACLVRNIVTWRIRNALPSCTKCFSRQFSGTLLPHKIPQTLIPFSSQTYFQGVIITRCYAKGKDKKKGDKGKLEVNLII